MQTAKKSQANAVPIRTVPPPLCKPHKSPKLLRSLSAQYPPLVQTAQKSQATVDHSNTVPICTEPPPLCKPQKSPKLMRSLSAQWPPLVHTAQKSQANTVPICTVPPDAVFSWGKNGFFFSILLFLIFQYNGYSNFDCVNSKKVDRTCQNANLTFSHFVSSFLVAVSRFVTLGGWEGVMCAFCILRVLLHVALWDKGTKTCYATTIATARFGGH